MYRDAQTTTLLGGEGERGKLRQVVLIVLRILSSIVLNIWEKVGEDCATREEPLKLVGHSTDCVGFSLSASVTLMTPTEATAKEGIIYLSLCILDERFVAPYFWSLPSIAYSDFDHLRRTLLRHM